MSRETGIGWVQDKGNRMTQTLSSSTSSLPAPQAAKPRGAVAQVAKPPQRMRRKAIVFRSSVQRGAKRV